MAHKRRINEINNSLTPNQPRVKKVKHEAQQNIDKDLKASIEWQDDEEKLLLSLYDKFIQELGQDKMFKTLDDLWRMVGLEITHSYNVLRSPLDCKNKFNSLKNVITTSQSVTLAQNSYLATNEIGSIFNPTSTNEVFVEPGYYITLEFQEDTYILKVKDNEDVEDLSVYLCDVQVGDEESEVPDTYELHIQDIQDLMSLLDDLQLYRINFVEPE